jgi:hypothetical protein
MDKVKEAQDIVDVIFDKPEKYKEMKTLEVAENTVDNILDNMENDIDHIPEQEDGEEQYGQVADELSKDSLAKGAGVEEAIDNFLGEDSTEYQKFFQAQLKKWGVSSPAQLPPDKKKEFFNMIDKKWKGKKESD